MWIDSHAHLDDPKFAGDLESVIARAREAGVERIVTVGTGHESSRAALAIASDHSGIFSTVGCHPHEADAVDAGEVLCWLTELGADPKVVGVGETGLDAFKKFSTPENQRRLFLAHLAAARALSKPVVIHCRDAHDECIRVLEADPPSKGGVIHCFSGDAGHARRYLDLGFVLSIAGPVTYPNAGGFREVVRALPPDRLMVETDCPCLTPQAPRGRRNEPAYVRLTGEFVADLLGRRDFEAVSSRTASDVFGLP